jgi:TatD DNase family protein
MKLTDTHCHLDFDDLYNQRSELLPQCAQQNIHRIVIPSIKPENWQKVLMLASKKSPVTLFAALGIHPWFLADLSTPALDELATVVMQNRATIVAIGEAGIDFPVSEQQHNLPQQLHFFEYQLHLAQQHELPIIIHHRRSHQYILPLLKKYSLSNAGVIHGFSGSYQQACAYIDLGFTLGVGGTITYPRAQKTINTIKRVPLASIVLETDAPSMPLNGCQGQHNSPLQLIPIFEHLTKLRAESTEIIAAQLEENCTKLFDLN